MEFPRGRLLSFHRHGPEAGKPPRVGRVHRDGSITYGGKTYPSIKDVPPECLAVRLDVESYKEWRRLYRAIDPRLRGPRTKLLR
jgi:hypothetical protein